MKCKSFLHALALTPKGGAGIRSYAMAQALIKNGHQVTMVCGSSGAGNTGLTQPFTKGKRIGIVDGINVIELELPYSNSLTFFKRIKVFFKFAFKSIKVALTESYDVAFATTTPLTASIPGIAAKWLKRKRFVFEVRDLWPELPKAMGVIKNPIILSLMSALEWLSYRSADRLIGLSPGIVDGIIKRGIAPEKIELIPNGCDLNIFANEQKSWRPKGVAETDLMAVFTGTHGYANGLDAVIDAAIELKQRQCDDIKIVLVGDGVLKERLMLRASENELSNIIFHDRVNKEKLASLMFSADLGLQVLANIPAFYYGTSPNKFFDYIAAGLPVINNYPGWLANMIQENECGLVVPPDSPKEFADALVFAANNRKELTIMGERAQKLAREKFDRKLLSQQFSGWVAQEQ